MNEKLKEFELHNGKGVLFGRYSTDQFNKKYSDVVAVNKTLKDKIEMADENPNSVTIPTEDQIKKLSLKYAQQKRIYNQIVKIEKAHEDGFKQALDIMLKVNKVQVEALVGITKCFCIMEADIEKLRTKIFNPPSVEIIDRFEKQKVCVICFGDVVDDKCTQCQTTQSVTCDKIIKGIPK